MNRKFVIEINGQYNGQINCKDVIINTDELGCKSYIFKHDGFASTLRERDGITIKEIKKEIT